MIYVFDKMENLITEVNSSRIVEAYQEENLNGLVGLDVSVLVSDKSLFDGAVYLGHKDIYNPNAIQMYRVINEYNEGDYFCLECLHVFFDDLKNYGYVRDKRPENVKASAALEIVLNDSRWSVGSVDDSSLKSLSFYDKNRLDCVSDILKTYGMELGFRLEFVGNKISNRFVDLYSQRGFDTGKRFSYGQKALEIVREVNQADIFTRIIPRGKGEEKFDEDGNPTGGYGRRIQITDLDFKAKDEIPIDKPKGEEFIELKEFTEIYGYSDGEAKSKVVIYEDITDPLELFKRAYEDLLINCRPLVSFRAKVQEVGRIGLGDRVNIIRDDLNIRYKTRVYKIKRDLLDDYKTEVELGDVILSGQNKVLAELKEGFSNLNKAIAESKEVLDKQASFISGIQKALQNTYLNEDGYNYDLKVGNEYGLPAGIYSFNKPIDQDPTKVIYIGAGTMAISNEKDSNGDFVFKTFGTGDGFVADLITAGILQGGKVRWNLEDGTFIIGDNVENYSFYWDGNTLHLKNVNIDLNNNESFTSLRDNLQGQFDSLNNSVAMGINTISDLQNRMFGEFSTEIEKLQGLVNQNTDDLETIEEKEKEISNTLVEYDQKLQLADGRLTSEITGIRELVTQTGEDLKEYVSTNFSSIEQTDEKIQTKVSGIKTEIDESINSQIKEKTTPLEEDLEDLKNKTTLLQSSIEQTDNKIRTEVSSIESRLVESVSTNITSQLNTEFNQKLEDYNDTVTENIREKIDESEREMYTNMNNTVSESVNNLNSSITNQINNLDYDLSNKIDTNTGNITQANNKINNLDYNLENANNRINNLQTITTNLSSSIEQTNSKIGSYVSSVQTVQNRVSNLSSDLNSLDYSMQDLRTYTNQIGTMTADAVNASNRAIEAMHSSIEQYADEISLKVSKNNVISSINQTSEYVKINAGKIDLTGDVTVSGTFTTNYSDTYRPAVVIEDSSVSFLTGSYYGRNATKTIGTMSIINGGGYSTNYMDIGHYATGVLSIGYYGSYDSGTISKSSNYITFDKYQYLDPDSPIQVYEKTKFKKPVVIEDIIRFGLGEGMQIKAWGDGISIQAKGGKGFFFSGDGGMYRIDGSTRSTKLF